MFVGPCEHHSNLLPWREIGAQIVRIAETAEGFLDLQDLEEQLAAHQASQASGRQLIGCFSAASNITGIVTDDVATTLLLHQYNALAFWDYATAAPYVKLDMNPNVPGVSEQSVHKDAIFFSMHKFVGGVQTPGVLVAKKSLFRNTVPNGCGGGTVFFVTQGGHRYLKDTEMREEGGTGAIVESVRAGLVMQLKEAVGSPNIMAREEKICKMVLAHIRTIPELILLGNSSPAIQRLPVFSFMVRHPRGTFLHHNFVCAVLNDVFGIQVRGGCACAGPYAQDLMGIGEELAADYEAVLMEDSRLDRTHLRRRGEHSSYEMLRPGFARVSIPYFMSDSEIAYVLEALKMVATEGWKLLPQYILNPETGEWRHNTNTVFRDRKWLGSIRYVDGKMQSFERRVSGQTPCPQDTGDCLHTARNIFNKARKMAQRYPLPDQRLMFDETSSALRWFMLPSEAQDLLLGNVQNVKQEVPFDPAPYSGARGRTSSCDSASSSETTQAVQETSPVNGGTPPKCSSALGRHNSLSSIDNLPHFVGSPTAPIQSRTRINSLQVPLQWPPVPDCPPSPSPMTPLRFCIGDRVHAVQSDSPQPSSPPSGINSDYFNSLIRMRCNSLGSPLSCSEMNAPLSSARSSCSCGSQVDLNALDKDCFHSLPPFSGQLSSLDGSVGSISSPHPDGIQAYLQEVTKELATEIKSEIREVISQVEDVLSDSTDLSSSNSSVERLQSSSRMRCDSVSAEHVAEYLTDMGKDLVSEMKTEIRGMVDGLISPDKSPMPSPVVRDVPRKLEFKSVKGSIADPSPEDSSEETVVHTLGTNANVESKNGSENEEDFENTESLNEGMRQVNLDEVKALETRVNSISSQDSGINLLCSESDSKSGNKHRKKNNRDSVPCRKKSVCKREEPKEPVSEDDSDATKPECSPCTSESENDSKNKDHCFSCKKNVGTGKTNPQPSKKKSVICVDECKQATEGNVQSEDNVCPKKRSVCSSGTGSAFTCPTDDDDAVKKACALRRSSRAGLSDVETNKKTVSAERLRSKGGWHCPPKNIWKPTMEAIEEFNMIRDGDKVMVCLSGGKDSLSLLHTLRQYQFYARTKGINFTLGAATVDPGSTAYDPKPLIPYLASLGVHYLYEEQSILDQAANLENGCSSVCSFCSRMKRGRLYAAARANGYNVLALGQHLDDLAESFLMSTFHNGRLRTMKAHYFIKERDLRVVRPFVYVREKALRQFAESKGLPIIPENCPACFEAPKERHRTKQLLAQQEILFPRIFWSLRTALHPLLSFRYTGQEGAAYNKNKRRSSSGVDPPGQAPRQEGSDTEEEPIS